PANVDDLSRILLQLPDSAEITPEQEESQTFGAHTDNVATFVLPADTESATVAIYPRFQKVLDQEFDETPDPITATHTFLCGTALPLRRWSAVVWGAARLSCRSRTPRRRDAVRGS